MPEIHSTRPSTLIHFEQRQRPFDFQCLPAERKGEKILSVSFPVIFTTNRICTYLSVQVNMWLNTHWGIFFCEIPVLLIYNENLVILSDLTFKRQHCCYKPAWMIWQGLVIIWMAISESVFETNLTYCASSRANGAPRIPSPLTSTTVIFIRIHIIHVGTLWSAT